MIPELKSNGEAIMTEVKMETLPNPRVVYGPAAIVYENPLLTASSFSGAPAEPRLTQSDEVWVPLDVKSSSALAIYYGYEQIQKFEARVIPEFKVSWPRKIAFDLQFSSGGFINNAFYMGDADLTVILPYESSGLPIAFNSGILAHEHFHAHFHQMIGKQVAVKMSKYFDLAQSHLHGENLRPNCGLPVFPREKANSGDEDFIQIINSYIFRGWNEGLADLYAALITGHTNFFDQSLNLNGLRKVDENPGIFKSREAFERALIRDLYPSEQKGECETLGLAYEAGTQVARSLYENIIAGRKASITNGVLDLDVREEMVRSIFLKLNEISSTMSAQVSSERVGPAWILNQLLPAVRSSEVPSDLPVETPTSIPTRSPTEEEVITL